MRSSRSVTLACLLALAACGGSSTAPRREPSVAFTLVEYPVTVNAANHLQLLSFSPSVVVVTRGSDPLPSTVQVTLSPPQPAGACEPYAYFVSTVALKSGVLPDQASIEIPSSSYSLCAPFNTGVFPIHATYTQGGKTYTADATVRVTER